MHSIALLVLIAYRFDTPVPPQVLDAVKTETAAILRESGVELDWWDQDSGGEIPPASQIYVIRFHGNCSVSPARFGTRGPLGVTHASDGEVLPFIDVDCDQIRATAMRNLPKKEPKAEAVLGRALARVASHELVHAITRSERHGRRGVAQPAFSPDDLTTDDFELAPEDLDRVRNSFR